MPEGVQKPKFVITVLKRLAAKKALARLFDPVAYPVAWSACCGSSAILAVCQPPIFFF